MATDKLGETMGNAALADLESRDRNGFLMAQLVNKKYKKAQRFLESLSQVEQDSLRSVPVTKIAALLKECMQDKGFDPDE